MKNKKFIDLKFIFYFDNRTERKKRILNNKKYNVSK